MRQVDPAETFAPASSKTARSIDRHGRWFLFAALLCLIAPGIAAHEGDPKASYVPQPYTGPGYQSGATSGPQLLGGPTFDSQGVTLLSWVTLPELGSGISSGECRDGNSSD